MHSFLWATTMKDCSILIGLHTESKDNSGGLDFTIKEYVIPWKNTVLFASIAIVDVDKKPLSKLSYYFQLDAEILQHFITKHGLHSTPICATPSTTCLPDEEDVVRLQGSMMCRLLYPNPVCLLSTVHPDTFRLNVMTITWLTPIDNHVNNRISMHYSVPYNPL